jgi:uncharacterized membrane protein
MKRLASHFLRGLVFLVPITATLYALVWMFRTIDGLLGLPYPGIGIVILLALVTLTGFLLSNYLTGRVFAYFEEALEKLPFTKLLYTSLRDLTRAFVGEKKRFGAPALVELVPDSKVRAFGFVTRASLEQFQQPDAVAVYLPQAYGFAGQLVVVPKKQVTYLAVDSTEVMAFIVSGGVAGKA